MNKVKFIGIIALAAIIGFFMASCGDPLPDTKGSVKITGIPAEGGKYIFVQATLPGDEDEVILWGMDGLSGDKKVPNVKLVEVKKDGTVIIPLFKYESVTANADDYAKNFTAFSGNGTAEFSIWRIDEKTRTTAQIKSLVNTSPAMEKAAVTITGGTATDIAWVVEED